MPSADALAATVSRSDDALAFDGVLLPDGRRSRPAPPLRGLDRIPVPDFTDFPWDRYPDRVVPVMTGRGCQWSKCLFCNDIATVSGRTFRTRPPGLDCSARSAGTCSSSWRPSPCWPPG